MKTLSFAAFWNVYVWSSFWTTSAVREITDGPICPLHYGGNLVIFIIIDSEFWVRLGQDTFLVFGFYAMGRLG